MITSFFFCFGHEPAFLLLRHRNEVVAHGPQLVAHLLEQLTRHLVVTIVIRVAPVTVQLTVEQRAVVVLVKLRLVAAK